MNFPMERLGSFALKPQQQENIKHKRPIKELLFRYNEMSPFQSHRNQHHQRKPFTASSLKSPEFQKKVAKIFKCLKSHGSKRNNQTQQLIRLCIETLRLSQQSRQLQRQIDQLKLETRKFLEIMKPTPFISPGGSASVWKSSTPNSSFSVHTQQHRFSYPGSTDGRVDGSVNHVMYNTRLTSMRLHQQQVHPIPPGAQIKSSIVSARQTSALTALPLQTPQTTISAIPTPLNQKQGTAVRDQVPASPAPSDAKEKDDVQEPLVKVMKLHQEDSETSMGFRESSDESSSFNGGSSTSTSWTSDETQSSTTDRQESTENRKKKSECSCCKDDLGDRNVLDFHSYLNRRAKLWIHSAKLTESMSLDSMPFNSLRPDGCGGRGYSRIDDERLIDAVVASKPAKKAKKVIEVSSKNLEQTGDDSTPSSFSSLDSIADCSPKSLRSLE